ncbi:TIGR01212 family radical SAM protein [Aminirod propionatiphilus]|uniref:TIGR01212 family radical SAM protein n=1 Tax=Aminirod propionatiphilus TaxID=3415223 RepID=A0ACD1DYJ5_9BACT|nr:TIGR01212 family radical SAM protein [Synergistota bacterium]
MTERRPSWAEQLKARHGGPVRKIALDAGSGCPNREGLLRGGCLFCDERGGGSGAFLRGLSLADQIRSGLHVARRRFGTDRVILYFQSYSATNVPLETFRATLGEALILAEEEGASVVGLSVGTRPDLVPDAVLDLLSFWTQKGLEVWLELGVQTLDEKGLLFLRRGHDGASSLDACRRARHRNLKVCAHLIAGLPGEKPHQLALSAERLFREGVAGFKFHPLHVLKGTALELLYKGGTFQPLTLEVYVDRVALALEALPDEIEIQRLTADAREPHLVAPGWIAEKPRFLRALADRLDAPLSPLIRPLNPEEIADAAALVRETFLAEVAPLFPEEGIETFLSFVDEEALAGRLASGHLLFAAVRKGRRTGVAELTPSGHLALLFVDLSDSRRGTGRALVEAVRESALSLEARPETITVNASPNAAAFYRRQGFVACGEERERQGIRYRPMALSLTGPPLC